MKEVIVGSDIFPELTDEIIDNVNNFLKKYNIDINYLFEDGISFLIKDNSIIKETKNYPGNLGFYDKSGNLIFYFVDSISSFYFKDPEDNIILQVKTAGIVL